MRHVGRSLPRIDARRHVTGRATFAAGVPLAGALSLHVVRSTVACGRLCGVDVAEARAAPGVVAVWTARDLSLPPVPLRVLADDALAPWCQPVLARELVRYVGEPIAAVLATTAAAAEDAGEAVTLDIEALAPVVDASGADVQRPHDPRPGEAATIVKGFGDVEAAFADAETVVEERLSLGRDGAMPLEPRGVAALWDAGRERLTVWRAGRDPDAEREAIAAALGLSRAAVEIEALSAGGSFGARGELDPETLLVCQAARTLERPVRFIEGRREHLRAAAQARGIEAHARAAVTREGAVRALDVSFLADQGAYLRPDGLVGPDVLAALLPGPYPLEAFRVVGRLRMTNGPPAGTMRGAGRTEATFVRERLLDRVAAEVGIDPRETRRRTLSASTGAGTGGLGLHALQTAITPPAPAAAAHLLEQAAGRFGLDAARRKAAEERARGGLAGVGFALFDEPGGYGPPVRVTIAVDPLAGIEVVCGPTDLGQGTATALAQIVADILGVNCADVRVTCGRTARQEDAGGTLLAGGLTRIGAAAIEASETLRETILDGAARLLAIPPDRLTIRAGRVREADRTFGRSLDLCELARAMRPGGPLRATGGPGLAADGWSPPGPLDRAPGVAIASVAVDRETAFVRVTRALIAIDVGNAVNPAECERQVAGAALQGIASTLQAGLDVDAAGTPQAHTLSDLATVTAAELPKVEVMIAEDAPGRLSPIGIKGAGAAGISGIGAAIAAAVDDALGAPGFTTRLPLRPAAIRARLRTGENPGSP